MNKKHITPIFERLLVIILDNGKFFNFVLIFLFGWAFLFLQSAGILQYGGNLGPGTQFLSPFLLKVGELAEGSFWLESLLRFCLPQGEFSNFGLANFSLARDFIALFLMWFVMSLAMMLPSSLLMFRTYADIATAARQKGEATVPLYILVLGYIFAWGLFSLVFSCLQLFLLASNFLPNNLGSSYTKFSALILIFCGFYQFSSLKLSCLIKCGNPFFVLFSRWRNDGWGVFRLGVEQGGYCIGCCWHLMLVLFVVGVMNLAWMAFFMIFTLVEKSFTDKLLSSIIGLLFIAWGVLLLLLT